MLFIILVILITTFPLIGMELEVGITFKKDKKSFSMYDTLKVFEDKPIILADCMPGMVEMTLAQKTDECAGLEFKVFEKTKDGLHYFCSSRPILLLATWGEKIIWEKWTKAFNDVIIDKVRIETIAKK